MEHLRKFSSSVPEFRRTSKGNFRHKLEDMLMLVILGRLCKCITRTDILGFGRRNLKRLQKLGLLCGGLPSESTLCRVFAGIDDEAMAARMAEFADTFRKEVCDALAEFICIDGKSMRGTSYGNGRNPDIVSAYSLPSGLTLATDMCAEKSNEIKSVPMLLEKLDICGSTVTADAMSFQKQIIDKIREKGADFLIELKANQRSLCYGIEDKIKTARPVETCEQEPCLEHGRIEKRSCRVFSGEELVEDKKKWNGRLAVIEICTETVKKSDGLKSHESRIYISSRKDCARELDLTARRHWKIESMHWDLDRNLKQDSIKRKTARAARNLDTIQRMVLNIFAAWKIRRKKLADKKKGTAELARQLAMDFTRLMALLAQK